MSDRIKRETVSEGDTARETVIYLDVAGRDLPVEIVSANLRISASPVIVIPLTQSDDETYWYFRWTTDHFTDLPARAAVYTGQVEATFDDDSIAYFPTSGTIEIKVNDPI